MISFLRRIFRRPVKKTLFRDEIILSHKDGEVIIKVESYNIRLAAHVSNSIKDKFRLKRDPNRKKSDIDEFNEIESKFKDAFESKFKDAFDGLSKKFDSQF